MVFTFALDSSWKNVTTKEKSTLESNCKAQHPNLSLSNAICAADLLYSLGNFDTKIGIMA